MNKQNLLDALEIVKPGLANREVIEQSTSFAFMNGRVVTYNDEISLSHPVEAIDVEGAVNAEELYQFLCKIKKDEIELTTEKNEIRITSGRAKAGLALQAKVVLPLEEIDEIEEWHELPEDFLHAVHFAAGACTNDNSRPKLTCVHVSGDGYIEGSDGLRIVKYVVDEDGFPVETFLIPAASASEVVKLKPVSIAKSESWVHFRTEADTVMSCRIFEDDYPDTTKYLKTEGYEISFPKTMGDILDRASVFAKREATKDEEVEVTLKNNSIKIRSESPSGWFEEEANTKFKEDPVSFAIVPGLLKDILSETQSCILGEEKLKFEGAGWEYVVSLLADEE